MSTSSPLRYAVLALRNAVLILTVAAVIGCSNTVVDYQQGADAARIATTQLQHQQHVVICNETNTVPDNA